MSRVIFSFMLLSLILVELRTGPFILFLVTGIWLKKTQDFVARFIALIFLLLIPICIYLSNGYIPLMIFTAFLPALYLWALTLQTKGWIMAQKWKHILFLHYQVDPVLLQELVPFKLDIYENKAIISIVSFKMDKIRFPFLPSFPGLSKLNELNLRTYVEVNGVKGVYFFTLDADLSLAIFIAKTFFALPYRKAHIQLKRKSENYTFSSHNSVSSLTFESKVLDSKESDHFDLWATERYSLFTKKGDLTFQGIVQHIPWKLNTILIESIEDNFSKQIGINLKANAFINNSYSNELDVKFRPFIKIKHTT
jgi:uncharacterized protein YqjF (DUF2071 family)